VASLRDRLLIGIGAFVLVTGLAAGGVAFKSSFDEAIELQDSMLVQIGALAAARGVQPPAPVAEAVDAEARITVEELGDAGEKAEGAQALPGLPASLPDGLQTVTRGGEDWRLVVRTRADGSRVAVGQPTAIRDESATNSALRTVLPLAALIPCLTLLVAIVIHRTMRPVLRLADRLDAKRSDDFEKLPLDAAPAELRPFIASINRLLERVGMMVDQNRRFIADAAHELRTPITALGIQAENLDRIDLPSQGRARLDVLIQGIRRIAHLLEQLLAHARYDTGPATDAAVTAFDHVARECVADLLPIAAVRVVDLGFARLEAVSVRGDATALAVMLRNLLDNALRHSPPGGRVDLYLYRDDDNVVVRIEDTGPGIVPADLERVFEPFFRGGRSADEGTGLGLSIVRRIVDGFDGRITIENIALPERSGLRVTVTLPAANTPRQSERIEVRP
jgi:two-component system, OmpR family, sensor kinase